MKLKKAVKSISVILGVISLLVWLSNPLDDYNACLENSEIDNADCLVGFIMLSPPVQDVISLAKACKNVEDEECLTKLGIMYIEEKVTQ